MFGDSCFHHMYKNFHIYFIHFFLEFEFRSSMMFLMFMSKSATVCFIKEISLLPFVEIIDLPC